MRVCVPSRSILCFCSSSPTHCDCVCVLLFFLFFMCMTNLSYFFKQLIEQISHVHIKQSKQQHRRTQNISQSSTTAAERSTRALQSQTRQMQKKNNKKQTHKMQTQFLNVLWHHLRPELQQKHTNRRWRDFINIIKNIHTHAQQEKKREENRK